MALNTTATTAHPAIIIDGQRCEVIGYGREINGWLELLVRKTGTDTLKSEADLHLVPRYWWDGMQGVGTYANGHTYRVPQGHSHSNREKVPA